MRPLCKKANLLAWTLLGKHGLNAKCFKSFPAPPVRPDFNPRHWDLCCRRKTLRCVGTSSRIRGLHAARSACLWDLSL